MTGPPLPEPLDDRRSARLTVVPDVLPLTDGEPLDPETSEPAWECVECCLPDVYDGHGDGIGSCDCPRCEGGCGCRYCADALGLHHCDDPDDEDEWEPWDDEDFRGQDPVLPRPAGVPCDNPLRCQWRAYPDTERWIRCGTHGCGVEYDLAADELLDEDGTAEASRWHPVRTITVAGGVL